ncbi:MAG: PEP-utilizing enzyme [Patescibacteria group bacterium]
MTEIQQDKFFRRQFKKSWLTQGLNGVPLYLSTTAESGHRLKKYLGFDYAPFLFYYKDNYAEGSYAAADFVKLWKIVRSRIKRDKGYLEKIRAKYDKVFARYDFWLKQIKNTKLADQSDAWLKENLQQSGNCLVDAMNLSHVIEVISAGLESDLKARLTARYQELKINKILASLSNVYKPSFINLEEKDLLRIKSAPLRSRPALLARHSKKYYWFNTNYTGSKLADEQYFLKRLKNLTETSTPVVADPADFIKLAEDQAIKGMIKMIGLTADWQDQRKVNIFKAIYHAEILVKEFSRRTGMPMADLRYVAVKEMLGFTKIKNFKKLSRELAARRQGCFQWMAVGREIIVAGALFRRLEKNYHSIRTRVDSVPLSIEGTTANSGRVVGTVVVCKSIKDLTKVRKGDILVTSMTRPEYLAGIKKAAALITDEGGITCHAAIVSRELRLPCIIGTKIATKALQTGDFVEVNANHGVVKLLKNSKQA